VILRTIAPGEYRLNVGRVGAGDPALAEVPASLGALLVTTPGNRTQGGPMEAQVELVEGVGQHLQWLAREVEGSRGKLLAEFASGRIPPLDSERQFLEREGLVSCTPTCGLTADGWEILARREVLGVHQPAVRRVLDAGTVYALRATGSGVWGTGKRLPGGVQDDLTGRLLWLQEQGLLSCGAPIRSSLEQCELTDQGGQVYRLAFGQQAPKAPAPE
jgi:hypothetical protein